MTSSTAPKLESADAPAPAPTQTGANGHRPAVAAFHALSVGYDRGPVLRDLQLKIHKGDFIAVVGPSGTGKTTLLRTLTGQARVYGGSLQLTAPEGQRKLRFGYVPQVEAVDWDFPITVQQVVMLGAWRDRPWMPWNKKATHERAQATLERLGIADLWGRQIRALSGGQQQRVFLARALVGEPDVLLLDEPTSGVDIRTRHEIIHLLVELNRGGSTIMLTTHDLNAVASHVDRLICISEGTIVGDGPPVEVLNPDILRRTFGAEMLVMQHEGSLYVVEANDAPFAFANGATAPAETPKLQP